MIGYNFKYLVLVVCLCIRMNVSFLKSNIPTVIQGNSFKFSSRSQLISRLVETSLRSAVPFEASAIGIDRHCYSNSGTDASSNSAYYLQEGVRVGGVIPDIALPELTYNDIRALEAGERVQKQRRTGRAGTGWVVLDVAAPVYQVFNELANFESYEQMIPTVRRVRMYGNRTPLLAKAEFSLSKFKLKVNVKHTVHPQEGLIRFSLDEDRPNLVMRRTDGFWYVEPVPNRPQYTRVWLSAEIVVSSVVPTMIVDYAACRALPRATRWIQPHFSN